MKKAEIRSLFKQKRASLSEAEYLHMNRLLCEMFFSFTDLSFIKVVHIFLPIEKKREPNTWLIIDRIKREFPHIRISVPKVKYNGALENLFFEAPDQLTVNAWGIAEPVNGIPTETKKIDMVLVPLLAFDSNGERVGYGKGFYDKFLETVRPDCKRVGISLFPPLEEIEDVNEFDIPLDLCITPHEVFSFNVE
jgi:5-formyltetrahydrofolate cyclo-ligase